MREKDTHQREFSVGYKAESSKTPLSALEEFIADFNEEFGTKYAIKDLDDVDPDWN